MTTKQTLQALRAAGKPICLSHFYRLSVLLKIRPLGRSRPQQYPPDTAERILKYLGFSNGAVAAGQSYRPAVNASGNGRSVGLLSVRALRAARPKNHNQKNQRKQMIMDTDNLVEACKVALAKTDEEYLILRLEIHIYERGCYSQTTCGFSSYTPLTGHTGHYDSPIDAIANTLAAAADPSNLARVADAHEKEARKLRARIGGRP